MEPPSNSPDPFAATEPAGAKVESTPGTPDIPGYQILELVGRGGMGKVYRAQHLALGRIVAIKVLAQEPDENLLARFRTEARAVARLQHPNIAQLFEAGLANGLPYYAQEFVDGESLAQRLAGQPQAPHFAAKVVEIVSRAIEVSHRAGILHRDLKPGNILLTADGTPKVTDFGLAKELTTHGSDSPAAKLTTTGEIIGTPAYMPPEQASGVVSKLGPATDVYSLGAILFEALTGRPPFQAPDALQTLFMVLSMEPVAPRVLQPDVPRDLETICLKCLEKNPRRRYGSAEALADDLRRFLSNEPILARPVGTVERTMKWARRKPWQAAAIGLAVLCAMALVVGFLQVASKNRQIRSANTVLAQKNDELEKAKTEAEVLLNYALGSMDEYHFQLSDRLAELPQGEQLRVEVLDQARKTLDEMIAANPRRPLVWEYLMDGYSRLGGALGRIGNFEEAATAFARSRDAAAHLVKVYPNQPTYRAVHATMGMRLAHCLERLGKPGADEIRNESARVERELFATASEQPAVLRLGQLVVSQELLQATIANNTPAMETAYRRLIDIHRRLASAEPAERKHSLALIDWSLKLATFLSQQNRLADADALLAESRVVVDTIASNVAPAERLLRAGYHETRAALLAARRQFIEANSALHQSLAEYESLAKDFPHSPNYKRYLVTTWLALGQNAQAGGKPTDAADYLRRGRRMAEELARDFPDDAQQRDLLQHVERLQKALPTSEKP